MPAWAGGFWACGVVAVIVVVLNFLIGLRTGDIVHATGPRKAFLPVEMTMTADAGGTKVECAAEFFAWVQGGSCETAAGCGDDCGEWIGCGRGKGAEAAAAAGEGCGGAGE